LTDTSGETELFTNTTPLGFAGGDTNLKRYCGNSPTNATDPKGLVEIPPGLGEDLGPNIATNVISTLIYKIEYSVAESNYADALDELNTFVKQLEKDKRLTAADQKYIADKLNEIQNMKQGWILGALSWATMGSTGALPDQQAFAVYDLLIELEKRYPPPPAPPTPPPEESVPPGDPMLNELPFNPW